MAPTANLIKKVKFIKLIKIKQNYLQKLNKMIYF